MILTLCNRTCVSAHKAMIIAIPVIGLALATIPSWEQAARWSKTLTPQTTQKTEQESATRLLEKIDRQCALATADHKSGLSIMLERDPFRREYQLKRIVLGKNREWKAQATGLKGTLEGLFKTTPFMVYKHSIDRHTRILNRAKRKALRICPEIAQPSIVKIDATVAMLASVNNYVIEHDHYLREHAASGGKGAMIGMLFKFIPSPLKFLA